MHTRLIHLLFVSLPVLLIAQSASAQTTQFTYQGILEFNGSPVTGLYDFRVTFYETPTGNNTGLAQTFPTTTNVENGLFTLPIDLGLTLWNQCSNRWMEIEVKTNGAIAWQTLAPRTLVTPAPYAMGAYTACSVADNGVTGQMIAGGQVVKSLNGLADTVTLSAGPNVTLLPSGNNIQISAVAAGGSGWQTNGNSGTIAGVNFLGTTDNQALEIKVDNTRGLRIEPDGRSGLRAANLIGGHPDNQILQPGSGANTIAGGGFNGYGNTIYSNSAGVFIGAGSGNRVGPNALDSVIAGGLGNSVQASDSVIGGGTSQVVLPDATYSFIGGGQANQSAAVYSTIVGGHNNFVTGGGGGFIGGGTGNSVSNFHATVAGGANNIAQENASTVGGGSENWASGDHSTVAGGQGNVSGGGFWGHATTIGGGEQNTSSGDWATVGGGYYNNGSGDFSTVGGGGGMGGATDGNSASGSYSTVAGGIGNAATNTASTVAGGAYNHAGGQNSFIGGGNANAANGFSSFAAGNRAKAGHTGSFVWADSQNIDFASTTNDQFNIRAAGGVRLNTDTSLFWGAGGQLWPNQGGSIELGDSTTVGATPYIDFHYGVGSPQDYNTRIIADGDGQLSIGRFGAPPLARLNSSGLTVNGSLCCASDRNKKANFRPVDPVEVLAKVAALPVSAWNYKEDTGSRHIGPMAQDFYAAFGVGPDDKHIATVDADGVALAAIQGLNQKLQEKEATIVELKRRLDRLEEKLHANSNPRSNPAPAKSN